MSFGVDYIDKNGQILGMLTKKQQMIGANLANIHTPGYQRQDVDFGQLISSLGNPLETKLAQKLGPSPLMTKKGGEVSAANELIEMQKNALFYSIAVRRVSSVIQELKTVSQVGK